MQESVVRTPSQSTISSPFAATRVASVDAFRGFVMLLMMAEVISFSSLAEAFPESSFWEFLSFHSGHVSWAFGSLHDMIQPGFTFLVGVALPFSIASRIKKGGTKRSIMIHTVKRSLILIFLGVFLRSIGSDQTYWTFEDTLSQIGMGYTFLVILGFYSQRVQLWALIVILVGYWLAFVLYPVSVSSTDYKTIEQTSHLIHNSEGFVAHWNLDANVALAFDRWFLNLFPRKDPFLFNRGAYYTLSFIPTLGTMILGLFAGNFIRSDSTKRKKLNFFIMTGVALIVIGIILHVTGINPVVKRIWTPAWVIWSGGICFLFLAFFYGIIDMLGWKKWAFFLIVIGTNSIAAYVMADGGMRGFIGNSLHTHLGQNYTHMFGAYATIVNGILVLLFMWLILYWMYKKKIFIKI